MTIIWVWKKLASGGFYVTVENCNQDSGVVNDILHSESEKNSGKASTHVILK